MQTEAISLPARQIQRDEDGERLLTTAAVQARLGGVSKMCIWRWARDPKTAFPEPDLVLNSRKYWRLATIRSWEKSRIGRAA